MATPCAAQQAARGAAFVQVPSVSQLEVVSHESAATPDGMETGVFRIRVRANHRWKVVLSAAVGGSETVWVRGSTGDAASYRELGPGGETVVATGSRGLTVVEIEYRRERTAASAGTLPLVYTLASL